MHDYTLQKNGKIYHINWLVKLAGFFSPSTWCSAATMVFSHWLRPSMPLFPPRFQCPKWPSAFQWNKTCHVAGNRFDVFKGSETLSKQLAHRNSAPRSHSLPKQGWVTPGALGPVLWCNLEMGHIPIPSMYGIFRYICHTNQPNVGKYTIHGCYWIHSEVTWWIWITWLGLWFYKPLFSSAFLHV